MLHSIATVSLSGDLEEKIRAIALAGFGGIEIFENDLTVYPGTPERAGERIREAGLVLVTLQPFRDFEGLNGPLRQRAFDRAERKFDLMARLGTDLLMVCSSVHPHAQGGIGRAAADFHELGDRAARRGMRVAYEALAWGRYVHDYRDSWEVVRRAEHPNVGLVLDTFHIFSRGSPIEAIESIPGDRIFLVQMADAPRLSMDHLSWSRHYRCFPGQGELPIDAFMSALVRTDYDGPLSLEIFNDAFRAMPAEQTAKDGRRSLILASGFVPSSQMAQMPRAQAVDVDFIEFTGDDDRLAQLASIFRALDFRHVGQHVKKGVQRWTQGDINFILNREPNSFASAFRGAHGTSVCAFSLRVADVHAAAARARALSLAIVSPRPGVDTHGMEALQSVDGALVYLVDAAESAETWRREFRPVEAAAQAPRIASIDHISVSVSPEQMLSEVLQYRSIFDMEPTPQFDITDPRGLVHSQVLQTPDRKVCIVLNSTQARGTLTGAFLDRFKGSGIQHVALRCNDVVAVAESARAAGMQFLSIPGNYYADLLARFGLGEAEIERMQALDILYDEDERGRFWHCYSTLIDDRFFFELTQRDGYAGFGAANAFVRAAALHAAGRRSAEAAMPR